MSVEISYQEFFEGLELSEKNESVILKIVISLFSLLSFLSLIAIFCHVKLKGLNLRDKDIVTFYIPLMLITELVSIVISVTSIYYFDYTQLLLPLLLLIPIIKISISVLAVSDLLEINIFKKPKFKVFSENFGTRKYSYKSCDFIINDPNGLLKK